MKKQKNVKITNEMKERITDVTEHFSKTDKTVDATIDDLIDINTNSEKGNVVELNTIKKIDKNVVRNVHDVFIKNQHGFRSNVKCLKEILTIMERYMKGEEYGSDDIVNKRYICNCTNEETKDLLEVVSKMNYVSKEIVDGFIWFKTV